MLRVLLAILGIVFLLAVLLLDLEAAVWVRSHTPRWARFALWVLLAILLGVLLARRTGR
jgi:uncharacterized protein (DUF983 family)